MRIALPHLTTYMAIGMIVTNSSDPKGRTKCMLMIT